MIGALRKRLMLETATRTEDGAGGFSVSWAPVTAVWASVSEPGGAEAVLGISYDGTGTEPILQALEDLAMRPETAGHIARKLAVHFVSDSPDADLVGHIRAAYLKTGGDLTAVYAAMLDHPGAWTAEAAK